MSKDKLDIFTLPHHEMVAILPKIKGPDREGIKASIEANGVLEPVRVWKDPETGQHWLIDGRNRIEIAKEINDDRLARDAEAELVEVPYVISHGSESAALQYVVVLNVERRHLNSSQRAAVAVAAGALADKIEEREHAREELRAKKKKRRPADATEVAAEEAPEAEPITVGDLARRVAREVGSNRSYIFDCRTLQEKAPDLLERVIADEVSIPAAKKILGRREIGLSDVPTDEELNAQEAGAAPKKAPKIEDGLKNPVGPDHAHIFATRDNYKATIKVLKDVKNEIEALLNGPGGAWLYPKEVESHINNLIHTMADAMPYALCPYCSGTGENRHNPHQKCGTCKGAMYLSKTQWAQVPDHVKALLGDDQGEPADADAEAAALAALAGDDESPEI